MDEMATLADIDAKATVLEQRADQYHETLAQIDSAEHWTTEHKAERRREAREEFETFVAETVRAARRSVEEAKTGATKRLLERTAKAPADERVSRLLHARGPALAIEVFSEQGNVDGLRALRAEIPMYVASQGFTPPERRAATDNLVREVNEALRPYVTGAEADELDVQAKAEQAAERLDAVTQWVFSRRSPASRLAYAYATAGRA